MPQTLTRQQLYARVWQQPMTKLAQDFGVSDVALHKICRKLDVPTPPAGYWTKKAFGKPVAETPLPNPGDQREVLMRESSASNEPEAMANARADVLEALERGGDGAGEEPVRDAVLERTMAKLRKAKKDREGLVRTN